MTTKQISLKSLTGIVWDANLIRQVKRYVEKGEIPMDIEDVPYKKARFVNRFKHFIVKDDGLYMTYNEQPPWTKNKDGTVLYTVKLPVLIKVVEDDAERDEILKSIYSNVMINGYRSADSLYDTIHKQYLNISREQVRQFVSKTEVAQLTGKAIDFKVQKPIVIEKIMEHHQLDLIDVSEHSQLNDGICWVMNVLDLHSKFLWSIPLKNKSGQLVAYELQKLWFVEGAPNVLQTDNGLEFINSDVEEVCKRFSVEQRHSLPYRPTTQGQVERVNGSLKSSIEKYLIDHNSKRFIDALPSLVFSYNNKKHSTTKFSPFQIHRGRDNTLSSIVHINIAKSADKMIEREMKFNNQIDEPIVVGDYVRVSSMSLKRVRKLAKIQAKGRITSNWSKTIHKVVEVIKDGDIQQFKLDNSENKTYFRYQLLKVDKDNLIETRDIFDKEDLTFGVKKDKEQHITALGMSREDEFALNATQDQLDKHQEQMEKKEKRKRKQTDHGAVISH